MSTLSNGIETGTRTYPWTANPRIDPPVAWWRSSQWVTGYSRHVATTWTPAQILL
jgi:hypothetical protein